MKKRKGLRKNTANAITIIIFVFLCIYVLSLVAMYTWAFGASLKTNIQFSVDPVGWVPGWPWEWAWKNYLRAIREIKVDVVLPNYRG